MNGKDVKLYFDKEVDGYGVVPTVKKPFYVTFNTEGFEKTTATEKSQAINKSGNPTEGVDGDIDVKNALAVEMDTQQFEYLLDLQLTPDGARTDNGDGTFTQVYKKTSAPQPSFRAIKEIPLDGGTKYHEIAGCKFGGMSFTAKSSGMIVVDFGNGLGKSYTRSDTQYTAGAIIDPTIDKVSNKNLKVYIGGSEYQKAKEMGVTISTDLDGDTFPIGQDGTRNSVDEGTGDIKISFSGFYADEALINSAEAGDILPVKFEWTAPSGNVLTMEFPETKLRVDSPKVTGPKGMLISGEFDAFYKSNADQTAMKVTVTNTLAALYA